MSDGSGGRRPETQVPWRPRFSAMLGVLVLLVDSVADDPVPRGSWTRANIGEHPDPELRGRADRRSA